MKTAKSKALHDFKMSYESKKHARKHIKNFESMRSRKTSEMLTEK